MQSSSQFSPDEISDNHSTYRFCSVSRIWDAVAKALDDRYLLLKRNAMFQAPPIGCVYTDPRGGNGSMINAMTGGHAS